MRRLWSPAVSGMLAMAAALAGCAQLEPASPAVAVAPMLPPPPLAPVEPPAAARPELVTPPPPLEPPAAAKGALTPNDDAERLLFFFERLKRMPGTELAKEHETVRLAYGRAATDFNRISYAMTLALPGTAFNDDGRALELLNPLLKKSENSVRPLVVLLTTFVQERRRLGGDLAALQQKLDALKSLERNLIERYQNNQGRK